MKSLNSLVGINAQKAMRDDKHLRGLISRIVPANSLSHILFCRLHEGRLRLCVDSASWASRLRFSERQLIDALRNDRLSINTVSWHVMPAENARPRVSHRAAPQSSVKAAAMVASTAGQMDDERLRLALLKLSRQLSEPAGKRPDQQDPD